jgi:hypothetical protein
MRSNIRARTALVTVVILTAVVHTAIAQPLFKPREETEEMESEVS